MNDLGERVGAILKGRAPLTQHERELAARDREIRTLRNQVAQLDGQLKTERALYEYGETFEEGVDY